jgi:hypothetical protein
MGSRPPSAPGDGGPPDRRLPLPLHDDRVVAFLARDEPHPGDCVPVVVHNVLLAAGVFVDGPHGRMVKKLCAVQRRASSSGANPSRQLSFQPVAVGAAMEVSNRRSLGLNGSLVATQRVGRP